MKEQYWISPVGEIIVIEDHPVRTMKAQPKAFGYTIEEMEMIYAKYCDWNQEKGEATKSVIETVVGKGWIYCSKRNAEQDWKITVYKLDKRTRRNLRLWAEAMLIEKRLETETILRLYRLFRNDILKKSVENLMDDTLFGKKVASHNSVKCPFIS